MSQQKQAPLPRQEFQEWLENAAVPVLVLQKGKHLGSVVKVPATPEIDYLFGCETLYGERISWSDRLEFCGLYDRQHQALHLLDDPLPNFVSGLTEEECHKIKEILSELKKETDKKETKQAKKILYELVKFLTDKGVDVLIALIPYLGSMAKKIIS